jgi:hypothetical protein
MDSCQYGVTKVSEGLMKRDRETYLNQIIRELMQLIFPVFV